MRSRLPQRDPLAVGVAHEPSQRRVADPAARPVGDPQQRDGVERIVEHLQVGDRVLDLRALVEPRAADHLVGDPLPHEDVFEHAALRVRAVDDGDLARRCSRRRSGRRSRLRRSAPRQCSSSVSTTRTSSPSPSSDQRFFSLRSRLCEMTSFAACEDRVRRAVVLLERDHATWPESRARTRGCCGCRLHEMRRSTGPGPPPPSGSGARDASSFSSTYCAWFVSWYSSTSM